MGRDNWRFSMSCTALMVCAALVFVASAPPSFAQSVRESARVYIGDLDLYQPKDAEELLNRIDNVSYDLCSDESRPMNVMERREASDCTDAAVEHTVRVLNHPMVNALHNGLSPNVIIEEGSADPYYDDNYGPYLDVEKK
jgi:UrcA family protein